MYLPIFNSVEIENNILTNSTADPIKVVDQLTADHANRVFNTFAPENCRLRKAGFRCTTKKASLHERKNTEVTSFDEKITVTQYGSVSGSGEVRCLVPKDDICKTCQLNKPFPQVGVFESDRVDYPIRQQFVRR